MLRSPTLFAHINIAPLAGILMALVAGSAVEVPLLTRTIDIELPRALSNWPTIGTYDETVRVGVTKAGIRFFNGTRLENDADLQGLIAAHFQSVANTKHVVYLRGDIAVPFGWISEIIDQCQKAGAQNVRLVAEPGDVP